jgi:hypothetical protein
MPYPISHSNGSKETTFPVVYAFGPTKYKTKEMK